ncbi:hypothetical protein GGS20DRAFT_547793 [Poronia punctata]|nr:hypothetical protein GGS20DRAFT_547793 [Poronia punctata]
MDRRSDHDAEKGKGKQKESPRASSPGPHMEPDECRGIADSSSHSESGFSRMVSSAASLSSGLINDPNHGQFGASTLTSGKAGSSHASHGSNIALHETARVTHGGRPGASGPLGATFRSQSTQSSGISDEKGYSSFLATSEDPAAESAGSGSGQYSTSLPVPHAVVAAMNDGSEVVDLLNAEPIEDTEDELNMTGEELTALQSALFGEKSPRHIGWDDALSFVPNFVSNPSSREDYRELAGHLGVSDATEARNLWIQQWEGVLSSYTPEVWGDLNPLVVAARQELQTISTSPEETPAHGLPAVRRLRQILAHIRGFPA